MRTIKFRGKDIGSNEWVYGHYTEGGWIDPQAGEVTKRYIIHGEDGFLHDIDPETFGEFTGLLDKNGKKIYEGDIVKHPYIDPIFRDLVEVGDGVTSEVVFHDGAFVIKYDEDDFIYLDGFTRHGHVEVVGNIYDNPKLIKEDEK